MWCNGSRKKRWLVWLGAGLTLVVVIGAGAGHRFVRIPTLPLPEGVSLRTVKVLLTGKAVAVDCYLPPGVRLSPVVIVAHGFTRNRKTMAGWGGLLAKEGFIAVVPDLPTWADHPRNGRALVELLTQVRAGETVPATETVRPRRAGWVFGRRLVHAAGGGGQYERVLLGGTGPRGHGAMRQPGSTVVAHPLFCAAGRTVAMERERECPGDICGAARAGVLVGGERRHARGRGEPDEPGSGVGLRSEDPVRRELFGRYLVASLRAGLLREERACRQLGAATNDTGVHEVVFRRPEAFRSVH